MATPIYSNGIQNVQMTGDVLLVESAFETSDGKEVVSTVAYTRFAARLLLSHLHRTVHEDASSVVPLKKAK
ncbi:MAG: hypothetical protein CML03_00295 [Pseudooceanicola sp.]|nr:hypothetical protein [Pseudooceanicola sp.]|tara:strand:- start:721 stop:933 length:213 start_codon:yes stop_codon:yes gene_type:complete